MTVTNPNTGNAVNPFNPNPSNEPDYPNQNPDYPNPPTNPHQDKVPNTNTNPAPTQYPKPNADPKLRVEYQGAQVTPVNPTVNRNLRVQLNANCPCTWSINPADAKSGSVDSNGMFTAGDKATTLEVTATPKNGNPKMSTNVTII